MKSHTDKFKNAMHRRGITPPFIIEDDDKLHDFISVNVTSSHRDKCHYIYSAGNPSIGLFGCKSRGISRKWSSKKIEDMTDKEQRDYENKLHVMKVLLKKKETAVVNAHSISRQSAIVNALLMEEPGQKKQTAQKAQAKRKKAQEVSNWNDKKILKDRVARRFLLECIEVIGDRKKIKTLLLLDKLNADESMPWYVFRSGKPIGTFHFSQMLAKFDIRSEALPFKGNVKAKGFRTELFHKAWSRVQKLFPSKSSQAKK